MNNSIWIVFRLYTRVGGADKVIVDVFRDAPSHEQMEKVRADNLLADGFETEKWAFAG